MVVIIITNKHGIEKNKDNKHNAGNSNVFDVMFKRSFMDFAVFHDEKFCNAE